MVARSSKMDVRLFKRLARDWEDHGTVDPFFGVLSDPAKRGKWDPAAFFESAGDHAEITAHVTNAGTAHWRADLPTSEAGHIRLANHWLDEAGRVTARDDGRGLLERDVAPGEHIEIRMVVRAPAAPGVHTLELDLVQEMVTWFADKGSPTLRIAVAVEAAARQDGPAPAADVFCSLPARRAAAEAPRGPGRLSRLVGRLLAGSRRAKPTFPMHVIPRDEVEGAVASHGARVLRVFEDEAAGPGWISYTYVCAR